MQEESSAEETEARGGRDHPTSLHSSRLTLELS